MLLQEKVEQKVTVTSLTTKMDLEVRNGDLFGPQPTMSAYYMSCVCLPKCVTFMRSKYNNRGKKG